MTAHWPDHSEFQVPLTLGFTGPIVCTRTSEGTWKSDNHIGVNRQVQTLLHARGQLAFEFYYHVWYPGNEAAQYDLVMRLIGGARHSAIRVMVDIESWGGKIHGDQTGSIEAFRTRLDRALGGPNPTYANRWDQMALYPHKPAAVPHINASYGARWDYGVAAGTFAQQYTNGQYAGPDGLPAATAPFGRCDHNAARGMSAAQVAALLGVGGATQTGRVHTPPAKPSQEEDMARMWARGNSRILHDGDSALILGTKAEVDAQTKAGVKTFQASPKTWARLLTMTKRSAA